MVCPATFTKEKRDARLAYTAVLKGLPFGLDCADLRNIYDETGAVALGLPRSVSSYTNRPWAYFTFRSQILMDAAMERSFTLKGKALSWCLPANVKDLCLRCSSDKHAAKDCDAFPDRGRSPVPKNLQHQYDRFKPAGYKVSRDNNRTSSKNRSRSCSRTWP